jgi:hypothetical protein
MALEDDGNMGEDVAALFDSSVAPLNLDATDNGVGRAGGLGSGMSIISNSTDACSLTSKHPRSGVWLNFNEVFETVDCEPVRSTAI